MKGEKVQIGKWELTANPLMGLDALELLPTILAVAGPLLSADKGADLSTAIASVAKSLASPEHKGGLRAIVDAFIGSTVVRVDGKTHPMGEHDFNAIFSGRYKDLLSWLGVHVKVNFADFFVTPENAPSE